MKQNKTKQNETKQNKKSTLSPKLNQSIWKLNNVELALYIYQMMFNTLFLFLIEQ